MQACGSAVTTGGSSWTPRGKPSPETLAHTGACCACSECCACFELWLKSADVMRTRRDGSVQYFSVQYLIVLEVSLHPNSGLCLRYFPCHSLFGCKTMSNCIHMVLDAMPLGSAAPTLFHACTAMHACNAIHAVRSTVFHACTAQRPTVPCSTPREPSTQPSSCRTWCMM